MQISSLLEKSREDFWKVISEIENSPLFRKLHNFKGEQRVIKIKPIKKTIPLPDSQYAAMGSFDVESMLVDKEDMIIQIRNMGIDKFRYYFLEGEGTDSEIADLLELDTNQVKEFRSGIIEKIQIFDSLYSSSTSVSKGGAFSPVEVSADIYMSNGRLKLDFARYRTRYEINENRIKNLVKKDLLSREELKQAGTIIDKMKHINERFNLLNRVIERVAKHQKAFLISGNVRKMKVLEGKAIAEKLEVDPSWISRLIKGKYIRVSGKIIPLRELLISERELNKKTGKELVRKIIEEESERLEKGILQHPYSDENIKLIMESRYKFKVSRRTVNNWRREIEKKLRGENHAR